jgi:predicted XRE-type DNA-binding protein
MAGKRAERCGRILRETKNVFADLGLPRRCGAVPKLRLAYALNQVLDRCTPSQAETVSVLGLTQPKISALRNCKVAGFSVERLMNLLTALD